MARLLIAVETYVTHRRGRSEIINAGEIAGSRSWVVENNPAAFRELEIRWPDPPQPKPVKDTEKSEKLDADATDDDAALSPLSLGPPVSPHSMKRSRGNGRGRMQG